jgi:hypothetical protein
MSAARTRRLLLIVAAPALLASPARADGAWTVETVSPGVIDVSLALDATGSPRIAFSTQEQPVYAHRDGGGWTLDHLAAPYIAAPAGGEIAGTELVFYASPSLAFDPASNEPRIAWARMSNGQMWYAEHSPSGWTYEEIGPPGGPPSLVIDAAGTAHVAYTPSGGPVYTTRTAGTWTPEPIGAGAGVSGLRLDASGHPHVAIGGSFPNSDMLYAERGSGGWSSAGVDTTGNTGWQASLALDAAGEPHLCYFDLTAHALRYAVRSGGTWTVETVTAPIGDGGDNSLVLGPSGEPFIAYRESNAGELRFARRAGGVWGSELVVGGGSVGVSCSMALDAEGRPHIAYYDGNLVLIRYATRSSVLTGVGPAPTVSGWGIERLAPNPARPGEALELALRMAEAQAVALDLADPTGRRVASRTVANLGAGLQTLRWDPGVNRAGLYFLRARFGSGASASTPLIVLR